MDIEAVRAAVRAEGLDGWLFCNFKHRDALSDAIVGVGSGVTNTRWWFLLVPAEGEPVRIVNGVEPAILDGVPGAKRVYSGREALIRELSAFRGLRLGAHWSETVSAVSYLDHGTALLLETAGIRLEAAESLVQRLLGTLDAKGVESHEESARKLYSIVATVWAEIAEGHRTRTPVTEREVQLRILRLFDELGMECDHPPIVAAGPHSGDPHYEPGEDSRRFQEGDVIQLDLWAKARKAGAIYADISWLGVYGAEAPPRVDKAFAELLAARDGALALIRERLASGTQPSGAEVDARAREILIGSGHGSALRHRLGHGIDTECHGSGANLDSVEFPDRRLLVEGSCFSIEPGIYFDDFGLRTEIDVYIRDGQAVVSGGTPQTRLLVCR
ncbi:MAG: aminopeptidase P family protein [Spirochaetales bacterium]|nr:aminopeptidase P family protein [Spirochaetales bacterium]